VSDREHARFGAAPALGLSDAARLRLPEPRARQRVSQSAPGRTRTCDPRLRRPRRRKRRTTTIGANGLQIAHFRALPVAATAWRRDRPHGRLGHNWADLIAELEPDATEAVEALQHHAAELVAADRRWHNVSADVSRLLRHIGNTAPHHNAKDEHKFSSIISAIRKAGGDLESPMPHWLGERDHQTEQRNRRLWRSQRPHTRRTGGGPVTTVSFGPASVDRRIGGGPPPSGLSLRTGPPPEVPPSARQAAGSRGPTTRSGE
jgi:hypothetical protein